MLFRSFLTLSMLASMMEAIQPPIANARFTMNYGANSLRFMAPVLSGSEIRGRGVLKGCAPKGDNRWLLEVGITVEIKGQDKPALVADWLSLVTM